jgi:hypothetical protein
VFTLPEKGILGRVGTLRVDAGTGELLTDPQTEQEILRHAEQLYISSLAIALLGSLDSEGTSPGRLVYVGNADFPNVK